MNRLHDSDAPDREEGAVTDLGKAPISPNNRAGLQLIERRSELVVARAFHPDDLPCVGTARLEVLFDDGP